MFQMCKFKVGDILTWDAGYTYLVEEVGKTDYTLKTVTSKDAPVDQCFHGPHPISSTDLTARLLTPLDKLL